MVESFKSQGIILIQNSIESYKGIVVEMEDGSFLDPVEQIRFNIDRKGVITCPTNPTVSGIRNKRTGKFEWEGYIDYFGQLKKSKTEGFLQEIKKKDLIKMADSSSYAMQDESGNTILAYICDGFLIMKSENPEITADGWPTMVQTDGHFSSSFSLATEVSTGQIGSEPIVQAYHNANCVTEGYITAGGLINMTRSNTWAGTKETELNPSTSFSGRMINTQERTISPEEGHKQYNLRLKEEEQKNRGLYSSYPDWYINPPRKEGALYAVGSRCMENKESAFQMAETIAAAGLSNQIRVQTLSILYESETERESSLNIQESINETSREDLEYQIEKSLYDEETQTAYILLSMKKD